MEIQLRGLIQLPRRAASFPTDCFPDAPLLHKHWQSQQLVLRERQAFAEAGQTYITMCSKTRQERSLWQQRSFWERHRFDRLKRLRSCCSMLFVLSSRKNKVGRRGITEGNEGGLDGTGCLRNCHRYNYGVQTICPCIIYSNIREHNGRESLHRHLPLAELHTLFLAQCNRVCSPVAPTTPHAVGRAPGKHGPAANDHLLARSLF